MNQTRVSRCSAATLAAAISIASLSAGDLAASPSAGNLAASPRQQAVGSDHAALVELFDEFLEARRAPVGGGVPDYSPAAIEARRDALSAIRARFDRIDAEAWPVPQRVDYLLVRAQLDAEEFVHRVTRPWARDPGLAVDQIRRTAYANVPSNAARADELRSRLAAVVRGLDRARQTLTEPSGELARMAIRQRERSDAVH